MNNEMILNDPDVKLVLDKKPLLQGGNWGAEVFGLQKLLRYFEPNFALYITGMYDPYTWTAVANVQRKYGLPVTTYVDLMMWNALLNQWFRGTNPSINNPISNSASNQPSSMENISNVSEDIMNDNYIYNVIGGDTLYSIANRLGTTVDEIKRLNNLQDDSLYTGQQLIIPNISELRKYTVKPGDTLYSIAQANGTTVNVLRLMNNLKDNAIYPGMNIVV